MYAVIKAGGKQHRVKAGDVIEVEAMKVAQGESLELRPILVVDDEGKAHHGKDVAKAVVVAKPVGEQKGDKVKVVKFRPKSGYMRRQGHRQLMTLLEIEDVRLDGRAAKGSAKSTEKKPARSRTTAKTAAAGGGSAATAAATKSEGSEEPAEPEAATEAITEAADGDD